MINLDKDMTLNITAQLLNNYSISAALLHSTLLMRETIKSNGHCSYSEMKNTDSEKLFEAINSKLKDLPQLPSQFTKTIFDRQQCAGMIQVLRTYRYFEGVSI